MMFQKRINIFTRRFLYNQYKRNITTLERIKNQGYNCEKHSIVTEDGYILTVFRIPGLKNNLENAKADLKPVLFQHGLSDSSDGWLSIQKSKPLPLKMADLNFDVWISNTRGNIYSDSHETLSKSDDKFWDYSYHEMGIFDLPAIFNYIKKVNASNHKIRYIGYSQGTTMMFAALTMKTDFFKENLENFTALAPAVKFDNAKSMKIPNFLKKILILSEKNKEVDKRKRKNLLLNTFPSLVHFMLSFSDSNSNKINDQESALMFFNSFPSSTSFKSKKHYLQNHLQKRFACFDYGVSRNLEIYKSKISPEYDLNKIQGFKIAFVYGTQDRLTDFVDVEWLINTLKEKNQILVEKKLEDMGHLSFLVSKNSNWFDEVLRIIA